MDKEEILEKSRDENWPTDEMARQNRLRRLVFGDIGVVICAAILAIYKVVYMNEAPWDIVSLLFVFNFFATLYDVFTRRRIWEKLLYLLCALFFLAVSAYFFYKFMTGAM